MAGIVDLWPVLPSAHQGLCGPQDISVIPFWNNTFSEVLFQNVVLGGISVGSDWAVIWLGEFCCCFYFMCTLAEGWWNWNCD